MLPTVGYSQKHLLELFKKGEVPGEFTVPKHIETLISNVFIFPRRVYKIYKNDSPHYPHLRAHSARLAFTKKDFAWNKAMSPEIYTSLRKIQGELVIVMNPIPTKNSLYHKLSRREMKDSTAYKIGFELGKKLRRIPPIPVPNFKKKSLGRIQELEKRVRYFQTEMPTAEWRKYVTYLRKHMRERSHVRNVGDLNADNVLYAGKLMLLDTYPARKEFIFDHVAPLYRIAVNIWTFGNKKFFDAYLRGIRDSSPEFLENAQSEYWVIYACLIAVSYRYMLGDPKAKRLHAFLRKFFSRIVPA